MVFVSHAARALRGPLFLLLWIVCGLWAVPALSNPPAAIDVAVSNSSNSRLFWADFVQSESAIQLNTDANQSSGLRSLAFFSNICASPRLDLIATNTNGGDLLYYAGGNNRWEVSTSMCAGGNCPGRPAGVAASNAHESLSGVEAQRVVAVDTGAGGTVPQLWFFKPDCENANEPFKAGGIPAGQFKVKGHGAVETLADAEFARVAGGGVGVGDLLVTVVNPNLIARVPAWAIDALLAEDRQIEQDDVDVLVPPEFFGSAQPAGLTLVPGTSGVGRNESLLVAVPPARVIKLNIGEEITTLQAHTFFTEGLGNGPLGIASGTRDDRHYMVITDRQGGRAVQHRLYVDATTGAKLCEGTPQTCPKEFEAIKDNLQFPLGVAFNSNAVIAGSCTGPEGCQLASAMQVFLPEVGDENDSKLIIAEVVFVLDQGRNPDGTLDLPAGFDGNFKLPATCRGFDADGWPVPVIPVVKLTTDVEISPATVVNLQEVVEGVLPDVPHCSISGSRIYHHRLPDNPDGSWNPDAPEQGTLVDSSVYCGTSRGMNDFFSPFGVCRDRDYRPEIAGLLNNSQRKVVKNEVLDRIAKLEIVIDKRLAGHAEFDGLRQALAQVIADARWEMRTGNTTRAQFQAVSGIFEQGAQQILKEKDPDLWDSLPGNAYGDLMRRVLGMAFYSSMTAAQTTFCPGLDLRNEIGLDPSDDSCPLPE